MDTRCYVISSRWSSHFLVKPGFHKIVRIVLIALVISKKLETIRTSTTAISKFHTIVSIASTTRDATGTSANSLAQTIEFLRVFRKQAKHNNANDDDGDRTSSLAIFLFSRFYDVDKQEEFHDDILSREKLDFL